MTSQIDINASWLDYIVLVFYFLLILSIGTLFSRFTRSTKDFFFGGQRFSWWLIAMSSVATVVGSYSFVKYSQIGYQHGFSSTMTYLNDWFIIPFFVLGWLPILYFNRIHSIPEYFARRFDEKAKLTSVIIILLFLTGYVGINFYTLGVALQPLLGINLYVIIVIVAIIGAIYMHAGGQTSVILTDLFQGFVLLAAGFLVFAMGLGYLGGWERFLEGLPLAHKFPFASFNTPAEFNFAGIFWQDAAASSVAFYFMNQGTIMRFLSCRSERDARKAVFAIILVLMPLAVLAIANTGWLGRSMTTLGLIPEVEPRNIFVIVASKVTLPGIFGLVLAALTAAMMSTIDTLINAVSAIFVNDVYRPYIKKNQKDSHYLRIARITAIVTTVTGILLVPFFASFKSIYEAHGTFVASITPPLITIIILAIFSKRITSAAAFWTLVLGSLLMLLIPLFPYIVQPVAHGIDPSRDYKYIRALFGIIACTTLAFGISKFTRKKNDKELDGLVIDSIASARRKFKGSEPAPVSEGIKPPIKVRCEVKDVEGVSLSKADMKKINAHKGDILFIEDSRRWLGGLLSVQLKAGTPHNQEGIIYLTASHVEEGQLNIKRPLRVEKII